MAATGFLAIRITVAATVRSYGGKDRPFLESPENPLKRLRLLPRLCALLLAALPGLAAAAIAPKVLVITMFDAEAKPWLEHEALDRRIRIPGLSPRYPDVHCDRAGLCLMTTDMGYANAASSVSALVLSGRFDLRRTYVLIAGIGGVDPTAGTLGSAHWARYAVDGGLVHSIDPRQVPAGWSSGVLSLGAQKPGEKGDWDAGTEVFRLDETLLQKAYALSAGVELQDNDAARAYRAAYPPGPGSSPPTVSICDTLSADTYWHGSLLAAAMAEQVTTATAGQGRYCTTQMEDNATLTALRRGADAGRLDFRRVALLRTGSNFDREAPGQDVALSLHAESGGFAPSVNNAYRVGKALAGRIVADWPQWRGGVPAQ